MTTKSAAEWPLHNGSHTAMQVQEKANIRRHIIEKDLPRNIVQLPNNLFYNTGIHLYLVAVQQQT